MSENMNDRELLELAANAAGYKWREDIRRMRDEIGVYALLIPGVSLAWNPLDNDGDALRLAVMLGIQFHIEGDDEDEMAWANDVSAFTNGDALSSVRRAIVRAAAEIGRKM